MGTSRLATAAGGDHQATSGGRDCASVRSQGAHSARLCHNLRRQHSEWERITPFGNSVERVLPVASTGFSACGAGRACGLATLRNSFCGVAQCGLTAQADGERVAASVAVWRQANRGRTGIMNELRKPPARANQPYSPSPRAIREECEHIQTKWSERERRKRAGRPPGATWTPPRVDMSAVTEAIREDFGNALPPHGASANDWDR